MPTVARKLRIQFRKYLEKGYVRNAQLDPRIPPEVAQLAEANESFIVRVDRVGWQPPWPGATARAAQGGRFWFSDHRVLLEDESVHELFRYESVRECYWMFKDLPDRINADPGLGKDMKRNYGDRLEIDLGDRICVLDGLGQAYSPVLHFFHWMLRETLTEPAQ